MIRSAPSHRHRSLVRHEGLVELRLFGQTWGIPVRPVWSGLIFNTLFYTTLGTVPIVVVRWLTRVYRRRRNQCEGCGYDLAGIDGTCPECGTAWRLGTGTGGQG